MGGLFSSLIAAIFIANLQKKSEKKSEDRKEDETQNVDDLYQWVVEKLPRPEVAVS